ncbi:MAG: thioredoxin family protein [Armatimonadota bacterium]
MLSLEARRYGVLMTPAIVINDEVVSLGKSPSEQRLRELIEKYLAASLRPGSRRANQ